MRELLSKLHRYLGLVSELSAKFTARSEASP